MDDGRNMIAFNFGLLEYLLYQHVSLTLNISCSKYQVQPSTYRFIM